MPEGTIFQVRDSFRTFGLLVDLRAVKVFVASALALAACSLAAQSASSSHPQAAESSDGGMVPIEVAQRAMRPVQPALKVGIVQTDVLNYCASKSVDPKTKSGAAPDGFDPAIMNFPCPVTIQTERVTVERRQK